MSTLSHANTGLLAALRRAWDAIELPFCKLSRIQFDAPWDARRRGTC